MYTDECMKVQDISNKELEALREIRNSLMHRGRIPSIRELMTSLGYRSPRSAAVIYENLIEKGALRRKRDGNLQLVGITDDRVRAQTVDVPLVGSISCGIPVLAEENVEAMIPVSTKLAKPPDKYFLLRAKGDSMDQKGVNDGDLLLIRQQAVAQDGDIVVALIDDEATVKEFHSAGETVVLKPMILGGFEKTNQMIQEAHMYGLDTVISSSFESSLGLSALAHLVGSSIRDQGAGLDTLKWFEKNLSKEKIAIQKGKIDLSRVSMREDNVDFSLLKKVG